LRPDYVEARLCFAQALSSLAHHDEAIEQARRAVGICPMRADVQRALGLALEMGGRTAEAKQAYAEALRLDPSLEQVRYDLAVVSGETPAAPPAQVVESLFDDYALRFEHHVVDELRYRAPQQIREALDSLGATGPFDVMDLGCGTGLVAKTLRDRAKFIVGVDLSPKMVEMARRSGAYDRVEQADAVAALRAAGEEQFDLVVAADVLIYVGEVTDLFAAAARALRDGGWLAVSIEVSSQADLVLQPTRRYAHDPRYVSRTARANGLKEALEREVILRMHAGKPLAGRILIYRKPGRRDE